MDAGVCAVAGADSDSVCGGDHRADAVACGGRLRLYLPLCHPDTVSITSYSGYESQVVVPSDIDGFTVVGIDSFHLNPGYTTANDKVKKVILPETVTFIGEDAFYQSTDWYEDASSALEEIVLPQSLKTIGARAFYNCAVLKSIKIPAGVTEIGSDAFTYCNALETIKLNCDSPALKDGAFGSVSNGFPLALSNLYYEWLYDDSASDFLIWQGQLLAYKGSSKTPVIPADVTTVGQNVFQNSDITGVTIPDGVKTIGGHAFYGCTELKSVRIPGSVEQIGSGAFSDCAQLSAVTFNKGLKTIGDNAFSDCEALTSVALPDGLLEMGINVFDSCYDLSQITFPSSLEKIDLSSIQSTGWYESLADGTELYCGGVFLGIVDNDYSGYPSKLTVRPGTKTVYLENYLTGVKELILPDTLVFIGDNAFNGCGSLKTVRGGENVKALGEACFKDCVALTGFGALTASVRYLEHNSLSNTGWYRNQPSGPVYFGNIAYCYKGSMPANTVLALKPGTTAVTGGYVLDQLEATPHNMANFEQPNLVGIVLPESCARVDYYAFVNCVNLKAVDFGGAQIPFFSAGADQNGKLD